LFNSVKFWARRGFVTTAILVILSATACVPARLGVSWAAVSTVGDQQNILIAYNNSLTLVDPTNGRTVELHEPDGSVVVDSEGKARIWQVTVPQGTASEFYSAPVLVSANARPIADDAAIANASASEATPEPSSDTTPVSSGELTLLVATYDAKSILKVDLADATIKRTAPVAGPVLSDLMLADDTMYVTFSNKDVVALDPEDLTERWHFTTEHGVWSEPLVVDGVLYFASMDHYLYAVDAETGDQRWRVDLRGAATSTPAYRDGHLYIGSLERKVFDISTAGEILGEYPTEDWIWGSPVLADDTLYVADMGGFVYALDTSEGLSEIWKVRAANMGIRPSPVVAGDNVIVASRDGHVYWLARTDGKPFLNEEIGAEILSDMVVIQPNAELNIPEPLLVVSTVAPDKLLVALTLDGGRRRWVYPS
jgi:outer membrane protein assembly factor BamB